MDLSIPNLEAIFFILLIIDNYCNILNINQLKVPSLPKASQMQALDMYLANALITTFNSIGSFVSLKKMFKVFLICFGFSIESLFMPYALTTAAKFGVRYPHTDDW